MSLLVTVLSTPGFYSGYILSQVRVFACFPGVTYPYGGYHHYPVDQYRRVDYVDSYDGESFYGYESLVYVLLFAFLRICPFLPCEHRII